MIFQKNPLTMRGAIDRCWLFAYQAPVELARRHLPAPLELVTRDGLAFWNVVVCHLREMRAKGLPACTGLSYWHVAYRLYAKFTHRGQTMEGLYFVRSDCDSRLIAMAGNVITHFDFHLAKINVRENGDYVDCAIDSPAAPASVVIDRAVPPCRTPHSAFATLEEAAEWLEYKPRGLFVCRDGRVNVVEIKRDEAAWQSRLVHVASAQWSFLKGEETQPEVGYEIAPIAYQWNRGQCW